MIVLRRDSQALHELRLEPPQAKSSVDGSGLSGPLIRVSVFHLHVVGCGIHSGAPGARVHQRGGCRSLGGWILHCLILAHGGESDALAETWLLLSSSGSKSSVYELGRGTCERNEYRRVIKQGGRIVNVYLKRKHSQSRHRTQLVNGRTVHMDRFCLRGSHSQLMAATAQNTDGGRCDGTDAILLLRDDYTVAQVDVEVFDYVGLTDKRGL